MKNKKSPATAKNLSSQSAIFVHLICSLSLAVGLWMTHNVKSINLVSHTSATLRLLQVIHCPLLILVYSIFRRNPEKCSYLKAVGRGILGLPVACVFGASWIDWQRLFAYTKPNGCLEYMISLPAYGAVIGSWFGAWPMPLDWERPWQEWPICVSYGTIGGYLLGMVASFCFVLFQGTSHAKGE
ncbi:glycosylphosphatidylinositol anchor biosynthesis protein 11 [Rutidosis leptorrhynchoides]|uniref:glycosylphosphatidylinositol anchor biosynthesis protein 11 n=1 Tax=Rutidosis leptorrhynchoides TaxID=125765 RepID=UPI003A99E967